MVRILSVFAITGALGAITAVNGQTVIYASGQLLIPGDPNIAPGQPGHDDRRENYVYAIDPMTGVATPVSPVTSGLPAALAGTPDGRLLGFSAGQLVDINPLTAVRTPLGNPNGLSATGFDITADGRGFITPFDANFDTQQIYSIDLSNGSASPLGSSTAVGDSVDIARGTPLGTAEPFIISLGSVQDSLYGIDLDSGSLISFNSFTGEATVVGTVGSVSAANGGIYSGFSALTGVDENQDGNFDALYGSVNFINGERLGGVARFDLATGDWTLIGTNAGVIFFGFGANPVPAPGSAMLLAASGIVLSRRFRH